MAGSFEAIRRQRHEFVHLATARPMAAIDPERGAQCGGGGVVRDGGEGGGGRQPPGCRAGARCLRDDSTPPPRPRPLPPSAHARKGQG